MQVNYDVFSEIIRYLSLVDIHNYAQVYLNDANITRLKNNFYKHYSYIQDILNNSQNDSKASLHALLFLLNDKAMIYNIIQNSPYIRSITQKIENDMEYHFYGNDEVIKLYVEKQMKLKCRLEGRIWVFNATATSLANRFLGLTCEFLEGGEELQKHLLMLTSRHLTQKSNKYISQLPKRFLLKKSLVLYEEVLKRALCRVNDINWFHISLFNNDIEIRCASSHGLELLLKAGFVSEDTMVTECCDICSVPSSLKIYINGGFDKNKKTVKSLLAEPWSSMHLAIECKDTYSLPLVFDFILATECFDLDTVHYRTSWSPKAYSFVSKDHEVTLHLHLKNCSDREYTLRELMKEYDYGRE